MAPYGNRGTWMRIAVVALFAAAMAFPEAAVVVYLRAVFHITGEIVSFTPSAKTVWFSIPFFTLLRPGAIADVLPQGHIASVEVWREAATMVMLLTVAWLAGHSLRSRFAYFILAFGVWDIAYYVYLRFLIGWPSSLRSLDVLFLIPGPWLAPVFLPVAISVVMILAAIVLLRRA